MDDQALPPLSARPATSSYRRQPFRYAPVASMAHFCQVEGTVGQVRSKFGRYYNHLLPPGDVISFTVMGQRTVIVSSLDAAIDLLEKKSAIYSDRPTLPMAGELLKWSQQLVFSHYGDHFRNMRKLLHRYLGGRGQLEKLAPYHDLIESEARRLLARILSHSGDFQHPGHLTEYIRK